MSTKCRYMEAAYPTLDYQDTCGLGDHKHDATTFFLARALAMVCQNLDPTDEQIGWFLEDAAAVIEDFEHEGEVPIIWTVGEIRDPEEFGLDFAITINQIEFVVPTSEWEPAHPMTLAQWREDHAEEDDDEPTVATTAASVAGNQEAL